MDNKVRIGVLVAIIAVILADLWFGFSRQALDDYSLKRAFVVAQTEHTEYENQWLGVRLQQFPNDLQVYTHLLYSVKPDIIVETGTFHGGSALFLADVMEHINPDCEIVTVDITDEHINKTKAEGKWLPGLTDKITFIKGDSVGAETVAQVKEHVKGKKRVLVLLDSLHTKDHVLKELEAYSPMVSPGSYLLVNDTHHDVLSTAHAGEGPLAAAEIFASQDNDFEVLKDRPRYIISAMHHGIFKRKGELDFSASPEPVPPVAPPVAPAAPDMGTGSDAE